MGLISIMITPLKFHRATASAAKWFGSVMKVACDKIRVPMWSRKILEKRSP